MNALSKRMSALSIVIVFASCINIGVSGTARAEQLDMDAIFRCVASDDDGIAKCLLAREMILDNCTSCHSFAPIVIAQLERSAWHGVLFRMNEKIDLSEADLLLIEDYLTDNFNENFPPPELPAALLEAWTSY